MGDDRLLFELSDGVAILTLNRPEVMNAFEDGMRESLFERLENCAEDPAVRCVVITGVGRAFSAGGDIASMAKLQTENDLSVVEARMAIAGQVIQKIRRMPQPVIAAINGAAAGGGMNLALACDMRIASDKAVFAESFVKIGLVPDWGGFSFLTKLIGTAKSMELMMLGDRINAEEALRLGLINRLVPAGAFREEAAKLARRLADGPPETLAAIKEGVYRGVESSLPETLSYEYETQRRLFLAEDAREGMQAFLEKRPANYGKRAS
ncbi:MAG: putative enoyl-CoA hydratase echA8 [Alphaproteobacteria bacterium MarineAlpha4_Bin2]|nr:MAG: putative enoyl-CoA hydratase echA8 [Alphaproteobacteria bacterium MarineAlpha4_Bin2]